MCSLCAGATVVEFGYNPDNLPERGYGYNKAETYDVAIYVNDASITGATVKGVTVRIPGGADISSTSAWLTSELKLKKKNGKNVNNPDILSQDGTLTDGVLTVMFDEPHVVTGPFYAGYSFTVDNLTNETSAPVMVADILDNNGLFIHSSKSKLKWMDCMEDAAGVSVMNVIIDGDFKDNSASFLSQEGLYVSAEEKAVIPVKVVNHGGNEISSIEYTFSSTAGSGSGSMTFEPAVPAAFGATGEVMVDLGYLTEPGTTEVTLTVTKVNGADNNDNLAVTVLPVKVYPFIPVNRPLVEEYTGLWCGWCVRGYVALETMKERYPDRFIGLAYHDSDPMDVEVERPSEVKGYPSAFINRSKAKINITDIYTIWPEFIREIAPASIDVKVEWTDDSKSSLKAIATTRFIDSHDKADFAVCYALLEDGMSDPKWAQSNAYAVEDGEEPKDYPEMPGELGRIFTHGPAKVYGLEYNDVVLALPQPFGYPASVPAEIVAGESYSHSCIFNVDEIVNYKGEYLVQDKSKLRVVASIIDRKTGRAVNCNSSLYANGESSVEGIDSDAVVVDTVWYDMQGRKVSEPADGIFVKVCTLDNGNTVTTKVIVR